MKTLFTALLVLATLTQCASSNYRYRAKGCTDCPAAGCPSGH